MSDTPARQKTVDPTSGHTVRGYDRELARLRAIILEMGERVVEQTQSAVVALIEQDRNMAYRVLDREPILDYLLLDADEEIFNVIVRRQPTAVDLRAVLALSKIAGDVERAGDKAARIARQSLELLDSAPAMPQLSDVLKDALQELDARACCMFERSIKAVVSFDVGLSLGIFEDESGLYDASHEVRRLLSLAGEGPSSPREIVCLLTCAHAFERIGNHATNIAEQVIYVAEGQDVRFRNRELLIETLRHKDR